MDLLYAMRDVGVADPTADSTGEETVRAALAQEIDKATVARRPGGARRPRPRLLAGATAAVAVSAVAVALLVGASASPPEAFAVTRHEGSVSVKINRRTSLADVNRKLAAMGIERIGKRTMAAAEDWSSIPSCSSIPPGWKGEWVQMAGSSSGPGYSISESVPPGTWALIMCTAGNPPNNATGNQSSGNTGAG